MLLRVFWSVTSRSRRGGGAVSRLSAAAMNTLGRKRMKAMQHISTGGQRVFKRVQFSRATSSWRTRKAWRRSKDL